MVADYCHHRLIVKPISYKARLPTILPPQGEGKEGESNLLSFVINNHCNSSQDDGVVCHFKEIKQEIGSARSINGKFKSVQRIKGCRYSLHRVHHNEIIFLSIGLTWISVIRDCCHKNMIIHIVMRNIQFPQSVQ